jgi:hypothetical protein
MLLNSNEEINGLHSFQDLAGIIGGGVLNG